MEVHLYALGYLQKLPHFDSEICTEYQEFRYNIWYVFRIWVYVCEGLSNDKQFHALLSSPYYVR